MIDLERMEEAAKFYRGCVNYDAVHNMDGDLACHRQAALDALETVIEQHRHGGGWSGPDFDVVSSAYAATPIPVLQ